MNNLTTRKIVLGMLMALVLAFSVQGIADALTFGTTRTGDLRTVLPGAKFNITFSVTPKGDTTPILDFNDKLVDDTGQRINISGYKVTELGPNNTEYRWSTPAASVPSAYNVSAHGFIDVSGYVVADNQGNLLDPRVTAVPDDPVKAVSQYHYNEEAVMIVVGNGAMITHIGSHDIPDTSSHSLSEQGKDGTKLLNSITVTIQAGNTASNVGPIGITISDNTPDGSSPDETLDGRGAAIRDFPTTDFRADPFLFTAYVVYFDRVAPAVPASPSFSLADGDNGFAISSGLTNQPDQPIGRTIIGLTPGLPVIYEIVEGSGSLYVAIPPNRQTIAQRTLSTASDAQVYLRTNGSTNKVRTYISGRPSLTSTVTYIYGGGTLEIADDNGNGQQGATSGRLENPLVIKVTDSRNRPVSGVAVRFAPGTNATGGMLIPVPGTKVYVTTTGDLDIMSGTPTATSRLIEVPERNPPAPATAIFVQTDSSGEAKAYFQMGTPTGTQQVTVTSTTMAVRSSTNALLNPPFRFTALSSQVSAILVIIDGDSQSAEVGKLVKPLIVRVRNVHEDRISGVNVRFNTSIGRISLRRGEASSRDPATAGITSGQEIFVKTDAAGEVWVDYNIGSSAAPRIVTAEITTEQNVGLEYDFETLPVTFNINGGGSSTTTGGTTGGGTTPPPVTVFVPSSISGTPGGTATLRLTAPGTSTVTIGQLSDTFPSVNATTPVPLGTVFTSILTLPSQPRIYSLTVFVGGTPYSVSVTVSQTAGQTTSGTLDIETDVSGSPGESKPITVTATNSNGTLAANVVVRLRVTTGGGSFSPSSVTTGDNGTATSTFIRGNTVGSNYFISATTTPTGYNTADSRGIRITIATTPGTTRTTVGPAAELDVYDGNNQDGSLNSPLAEPFIVEVVDANDNPVEDARVRFRTTIGTGRFSPRTPRTDEDGFAETTFTPTSAGRIRVVATVASADSTAAFIVQGGEPADALVKVSGDDQSGTPGNALAAPFVVEVQDEDGEPLTGHSVTFSVTAGGGSLSETSVTADEDGRAETTLTLGSAPGVNSVRASVTGVDPVTFSTSIDAKILVAAANRPVMYWIAGGGLYSLSGAKEAKIAESANGVAVGGGKIYWTEMTGESGGTVNSANLDGTDVTELASIFATPIGIAVDAAGSKLYWTNSRGRIQSANLDGSGIKNVMQNLSDPTDIVVSNGFIYWTEGGNSVRRVNISGQVKIAIDVAVNLETVGGLAVGGGKVYWTEQTSATAGTVNGANLNGTNFETLATLLSAPMGISVDTAGSKLYWTNARGRVQSANLDGSMIKNVVEGLISPSKLAIGGANTATITTAKKATTPAKKDNAKYDVNGDGTVDNTDASLVSAGFDTGNAKLDVNGDGMVNFLDLLLVFDNRDDNAAGAPTIVGMRLTAIQIERIEEQIGLLIATNDRSPAALRTLVYLQQLLATARPEKTQLFANYPNPFNPETWIPYELATDTHVTITIYNTQGVVIRTLQFGHQSAGYYTDRDRAAYWDGRNALGEQVASGLYFYQLETDEMSSMRKMVILK